jgi:heat-inducible transcriptional repressor
MQLTERQERILKAIVELYIAGARPVGSAALVSTVGLGVSPATVRNEMAVLEELGFIQHLHTSGGRVPTNAGYRYFVERLMEPSSVSSTEARTIRHQFHQAHTELQEWLKLAATIMAHRMRNVGLVTAPKSTEAHLRHLEVISIQNAIVLLIVVLPDGTVLQEMMALEDPHSQEELSALADRLNQVLSGMTASQIESKAQALPKLESSIAAMAAHLLRRGDQQHAQIFHAGLGDMIQQPEFMARHGESPTLMTQRLRQMVDFLYQGFEVQRLLAGLPTASDVQIVIGGESEGWGLQEYSMVLSRYGDDDESSGFLGIVGPTRMEYPRAVAIVRYMTDVMTDLMHTY